MSACCDNGHEKYNERRRSESLLFQMQLRSLSVSRTSLRLIFTKDKSSTWSPLRFKRLRASSLNVVSMPIVRACRHEEFEPQKNIGIYLQVRNSFDFQRGLCVIITIDERLSYSKVDSYFVWRLKHFMSACSDNGQRKYNERRRSESLVFQMQLRSSSVSRTCLRLIFAKDKSST